MCHLGINPYTERVCLNFEDWDFHLQNTFGVYVGVVHHERQQERQQGEKEREGGRAINRFRKASKPITTPRLTIEKGVSPD